MIKNYTQFNESTFFPTTKEEIRIVCKKYNIVHYTINEDMSIDVDDSVGITHTKLIKLPLKFNKVNGDFHCNVTKLESLEGCPKVVNGDFNCSRSNLNSLKFGPKEVNGYYDCSYNHLEDFEGIASIIGGYIYSDSNNLKSFKGVPEDFEGNLYCDLNPIYEIYKLFYDSKAIYWINEYDVIQGDNVILDRLEEVFIQLDMEVPNIKEIEYYNLI